MPYRSFLGPGALALAIALAPSPAKAQRADTNVVKEAEDAFGYAAGADSIGLYSAASVRGFSPTRAGNMRIEGLYFDWQAIFTGDVVASTRVHVGSSAIGLPFGSPSGIVDYTLRRAAPTPYVSVSASYGPFQSHSTGIELGRQIGTSGIGMVASAAYERADPGDSIGRPTYSIGGVLDKAHSDRFAWTAFAARQHYWDDQNLPFFRSSGSATPVEVDRRTRMTQPWATSSGYNDNAGVLVLWRPVERLLMRAGLFGAQWLADRSFDQVVYDADVPGQQRSTVFASRDGVTRSVSGELQATYDWTRGDRPQRTVWSVRGRRFIRRFGGGRAFDLGPFDPGADAAPAPPPLQTGPLQSIDLDQAFVGVAHQAALSARTGLNVGVQHVWGRQQMRNESSDGAGSDRQWLLSGGVQRRIGEGVRVFASYSEGSESLGAAPASAANRYEVLPNIVSTQRELGASFKLGDGFAANATMFALQRPFAGPDEGNVYRVVGDLESRGVEASMSLRHSSGLVALVGLLWLDATVGTGAAVSDERPIGLVTRQAFLSLDYPLPTWSGASIDGRISYQGDALIDPTTELAAPARRRADLGLRWQRPLEDDALLAVRLSINNLTNDYGWVADRTGALIFSPERSVNLSVTTRF